MTPVEQAKFESAQSGASLLALFVQYCRPIGAHTEGDGEAFARFYSAIVETADAGAGPWNLSFSQHGQIVFLPVSDVNKALSKIWGALARCNGEATSWLAQMQPDGTWRDLIPERGAVRELPPEIQLLPRRIYQLEDELKFLVAEHETIKEASAARRGKLDSGRVIDAAVSGGYEHGARIAWVSERIDAVRNEISGWRAKLTDGQS